LPSGVRLEFGVGEHNLLQKAIIEEFLPRYGYGASVIYVGDAEDKFLHYDQPTASSLGLSRLAHAELPDVIAFSEQKNWLFLIEAVHSSGPISPERIIVLQSFVKNCSAPIVYVTAFLDRATFRKFLPDIAWETEVWIASEPDHLIHFDGDKFLGPY
jgi:type II restriction enzyme